MKITAEQILATEQSLLDQWEKACNHLSYYGQFFYFFYQSKHHEKYKRLFRLLAVAFLRDVGMVNNHTTEAKVAELYADGLATEQERDDIFRQSQSHVLACLCAHSNYITPRSALEYIYFEAGFAEKTIVQGQIIIDFLAPGYSFQHDWKTDTAISIAKVMYETNDFSAMPILADALQDADCNEPFLKRMRERTFYKGCWIVDKLLNKR